MTGYVIDGWIGMGEGGGRVIDGWNGMGEGGGRECE